MAVLKVLCFIVFVSKQKFNCGTATFTSAILWIIDFHISKEMTHLKAIEQQLLKIFPDDGFEFCRPKVVVSLDNMHILDV